MPEKVNLQRCTICGNFKEEDQTWFLMTESCWEDKLNVWKWNQAMAAREAVHSLCSPRHVRELIIHWMTTGCLHYPFAQACPSLTSFRPKSRLGRKGHEETSLPYRLGEIAVDRNAVSRILVEDPLSLTTLLDELMMTLEQEVVEDVESGLLNDLYLWTCDRELNSGSGSTLKEFGVCSEKSFFPDLVQEL